MSLHNLYGFPASPPGEEEIEYTGLGHDVHSAGGHSGLGPALVGKQHVGPEYGGQVVEAHFVLVLAGGHLDHVLDEEDDAGLVGVLRDCLREDVEVSRLPDLSALLG